MRVFASIGLALVAACAPLSATATPVALELRTYSTQTPLATASLPVGVVVSAPAPLPSPTPFRYTVQSGDTLSQLAEKFHVTLDALLAVNPEVNPNALPLGQTIKIPSSPNNLSGDGTPTPVPIPIEQAACHAIADGGLWCFILIHNEGPEVLENVTAQVTLISPDGRPGPSQAALPVLDILPPGKSLPLSVFFQPGVPLDAAPQVQFLTANRVITGDQRYLPAELRGSLTEVSWSGLSAQMTGQVFLPAGSKTASLVWVAAVAYDGTGRVVGLRRWEADSELKPGASLPFSFMISSVAGRIERVDFAVEARP